MITAMHMLIYSDDATATRAASSFMASPSEGTRLW